MTKQFFVFLLILSHGMAQVCPHSTKCFCTNSTSRGLEFQCPSMFEKKVLVLTQPYLLINCLDRTSYNPHYLPDYLDEATEIEMRGCPLQTEDLMLTLKHFNVSKLDSLKLEEIRIVDKSRNRYITKDLFKGLQSAQTLILRYIDTTIDRDFLEYLPNLEVLYMEKNNIRTSNFKFNYAIKLNKLWLSQNSISDIQEDTFKDLVNLKQLHLENNKLAWLTKASFNGLSQLTSLELSKNALEVLKDDVFSNMPNLRKLNLSANKLRNITEHLFKYNTKLESLKLGFNPGLAIPSRVFVNLENLQELELQSNLLEEIPLKALSAMKNLRKLNLASNKLLKIPDRAFGNLGKLESLDMSGNQISEVSAAAFKGVTGLQTIFLRKNKIKYIESKTFHHFELLDKLDVSFNLLVLENQDALMNGHLVELIVRNNLVEKFPDEVVLFNYQMKNLDLSHNRISYVNVNDLLPSTNGLAIQLCSNNLTEIDFQYVKSNLTSKTSSLKPVQVKLANNHLLCNCRVYSLLLYLNMTFPREKVNIDLDLGNVFCSYPEELRGRPIIDIKRDEIKCEKQNDDFCPTKCSCYYKLYKTYEYTYVIDCQHRQLLTSPTLNIGVNQHKIEVNLGGNLIESGPDANMGYERVNSLNLSYNRIQNFDWVPPNIEVLDLDQNRLSFLPETTISSLKKAAHLEKVILSNNPWNCDCAAAGFFKFVITYSPKVNGSLVLCAEDNVPSIHKVELCSSPNLILKTVLPIVIMFLVLVILVMRFKHYIIVWLFSKRMCMWIVSEKDVDKDKKYDVFISYGHQDEDFVMIELLPILETEPNEFKICIHIRDWIPGELITTQVERSVHDSRRTLVVLSDHFLDSCWGRLEFKTAHVKAIRDNCSRVIVIKCGDLDEKKLDDDLRSYLKTNTYVEWGSPWFWKKLLYALPHRKTGGYQERLKSAMLKIDFSGMEATNHNKLDAVTCESPLIGV